MNYAKLKTAYKSQLVGNVDEGLLEYSFQGYKVGHGTYFTQLMAEGGLFLTVPYLWLIFGFLVRSFKFSKKAKADDHLLMDLLIGIEAGVGWSLYFNYVH